MSSWYVAYRKGRDHALQVATDRDAAIATAFALLDRGIDVTEVGPTAGPRRHRLDATAIRELCHMREHMTESGAFG